MNQGTISYNQIKIDNILCYLDTLKTGIWTYQKIKQNSIMVIHEKMKWLKEPNIIFLFHEQHNTGICTIIYEGYHKFDQSIN